MFQLVAILLLITKHTFGQKPSICAEVPNNNYVRNSQSCNSYYQCIIGQESKTLLSQITVICITGAQMDSERQWFVLFDRKIGDCNIAERVICETKNTICEQFAWLGTIVIGNPVDCSSYYYCVDGRAVEAFCPNGQFYNPLTAICEPLGTTNFCQGVGPIITTPIPLPTTREPTQPTAKSSIRIVYMKSTAPVTESSTEASTTTARTTTTTTRSTTITTSTSAQPSATEPPATEPSSTEPPATEPPETDLPETDSATTEPSATPAPPPVLTCEVGITGYFAFPPPDNCVRYYYCSRGLLRYQLTYNPPQFFTPGGDRCTDNVPPECEYLLPQIDDV